MSDMRPLDVMIVEDEGILAMDLEYMLEIAGHRVAGWATCFDEAQQLSTQIQPDLVLVDVHLTDGITGLEVAALMRRAGRAAVVFMTANPRLIPSDFLGAVGVIAKPYTAAGVQAALRFVQQGIFDPPPALSLPIGLTLAPAYKQRWVN